MYLVSIVKLSVLHSDRFSSLNVRTCQWILKTDFFSLFLLSLYALVSSGVSKDTSIFIFTDLGIRMCFETLCRVHAWWRSWKQFILLYKLYTLLQKNCSFPNFKWFKFRFQKLWHTVFHTENYMVASNNGNWQVRSKSHITIGTRRN